MQQVVLPAEAPHSAVRIVEVGPRDGLQNIKTIVPTKTKIELIERLSRTGLQTIEATSFVSPRWIPQLADGTAVMQAISNLMQGQISYPVLVPNVKGLTAAANVGVREIGVFISASEGFSRNNINCSIAESLERVQEVVARALPEGIRVRAYVSCIFTCPFDGPTDPSQVLVVAQKLLAMGCYEISLGDTLGVGSPTQVRNLLGLLLQHIPATCLAAHFHDTYGQAVANAVTAYQLGIRVFDSSVAGLGGCPYSPGAKGNLATEDLVYTFQQMNIPTGVDMNAISHVGEWIATELGIQNNSRAGLAICSKSGVERKTKGNVLHTKPVSMESISESDEYEVSRDKSVVTIALNRPRNGNALTISMLTGLTKLFMSCAKDTSIYRIVLTARGKFFCTGMDLGADGASSKTKEANFVGLRSLFEAIDSCPQTTIAVIHGPAFGGGVGLAFACDIRLASKAATFTLTEVKLGICPAVISKYVFREWGIAFTREAMLSARRITAHEIYTRTGSIHSIAEGDTQLLESLQSYVDKLKYCAPKASAEVKDLARAAWRFHGSQEQDSAIKDAFDRMLDSDESRTGMDNFRQKRGDLDWEKALGVGQTKL